MSITRHRVGRDKWNIDWNIVARVDPEYAKKHLYSKITNAVDFIEFGDVQCKANETTEIDWNLWNDHRHMRDAGDPGVPLLPIPKRFLGDGSTVHFGNYLVYTMHGIKKNNRDPNVMGLTKQSIRIDKDAVKCTKCTYYFDRVRNFTSEIKTTLSFLTFSEKTKGIYWTSYEKVDKRFTRLVARLGLRHDGVNLRLGSINKRLAIQFVAEVTKRAKRDLGDIYLPSVEGVENEYFLDQTVPSGKLITEEDRKIIDMVSNPVEKVNKKPKIHLKDSIPYMAYTLSAIIWQYKAGQPLKWITNRTLLKNISNLLSTDKLSVIAMKRWDTGDNTDDDYKKYGKWRAKILRKINDEVKLTTSPKVILKSVFGEFYKNIYFTLFDKYVTETLDEMTLGLFHLEVALQRGHAPKSITHLLVKVVNGINSCDINYDQRVNRFEYLRIICNAIKGFENIEGNPLIPNIDILDKWSRFNSRLFDTEKEPMEWHQFRDTFNMAKEVSIRIRLNKCHSSEDVMRLHDKFSEYIIRDGKMLRAFPIFFPFKHPNKEYDGFEFVHLDTANELLEEGINMKHCIGNYAHGCYIGNSIIFSMRHDRSWITLELNGDNYKIHQKYTVGDFKVENESIKGIINTWHKDLVKMHSKDSSNYQKISQYINDVFEQKYKTNEADITKLIGNPNVFGLSKEEVVGHINKLELSGAHPFNEDDRPRPRITINNDQIQLNIMTQLTEIAEAI